MTTRKELVDEGLVIRRAVPGADYVEVFMQAAIYCGVPAALTSFAVAKRVLAERPARKGDESTG